MAMQQHALANAQLGNLLQWETFNAAPEGEPADWQVTYYYEQGTVNMWVENNNYKYRTTIYKKQEENNCFHPV